ncbi:MAG: VCBS repeat-containing protein, partial [Planctomycetaceae bacterium]|nr:VCBS repeat-containing protein [Planctomycetaceae bacterium]
MFNHIIRPLFCAHRRFTGRRSRRFSHSPVEKLEQRVLLTTYVVDNTGDANDGNFSAGQLTFREAVVLANNNSGPDVIQFSPSIAGSTIHSGGNFGSFGDLEITGDGAQPITITGTGFSHALGDLTIRFLRFEGCYANNGGFGGAIYSRSTAGMLSIHDSQFVNNRARQVGGAIYAESGGAGVEVFDSHFSGNSCQFSGGAIYAGGLTSPLHVEDSSFSANRGYTGGSAISTSGGEILRSYFTGHDGTGHAVANHGGSELVIVDSTIAGNGNVGGITNGGTLYVINSTVSGNHAFSNGGGIHNSGSLIVTNSTIVFNEAQGAGTFATGGGIYSTTSNVILNNTIVGGNYRVGPGSSSDIVVTINDNPGTINVAISHNNLIGDADSAGGLMNGSSGNIVGVNGVGIRNLAQVIAPSPADNGGPTLTHALVSGSVAINAGDNAFAIDRMTNPLAFDQRGTGFDRVIGGTVDIGAFEAAEEPIRPDDLILFDQVSGRWKVGRNEGNSFSWVDGPRWNPASGWQTFTGDVNGDGFVDGIGFNSSNAVFVALNDGLGQLTTVSAGGFNSTAVFSYPMVGDFDGNGTVDFVAQLSSGEWFSKRWNGTSFETGFYGRWTPDGWSGFRVGDFNGDQVSDIIGLRDSTDGTRANW